MRVNIEKWLMAVGILVMGLILSGCFFSEQTLIISPDGKTDVKIEFWFDQTEAGDQGAIGMQELLYLFPELQDYKLTKRQKDIGYSSYLVYTFQKNNVDVNENQYINFAKRDDGSYILEIMIPKAIEEEKEKNDKVLSVKVTMPAEIDMANTMNYEGRMVEWELRQNNFTRDTTLKAFTKIPLQEEKKGAGEERSYFSTPENVVRTYYEAIFAKQDESLQKACYSKATCLLLDEAISPPVEIENRLEDEGIGFRNYTEKVLAATYSIDTGSSEKYGYPEDERLVKVEFNEKSHSWRVVREGGEWKIAMPVVVTKEQGEIWLKSTPVIQPFFDLSTPENIIRSFMEAVCFGDEGAAKKCWSSRLPNSVAESYISAMTKTFEDIHPEFLKFLVRGTQYRADKIDEDNYYAFTVPPGSQKGSTRVVFRVTREDDSWRILLPKQMEEDPSFALLRVILGID